LAINRFLTRNGIIRAIPWGAAGTCGRFQCDQGVFKLANRAFDEETINAFPDARRYFGIGLAMGFGLAAELAREKGLAEFGDELEKIAHSWGFAAGWKRLRGAFEATHPRNRQGV
jgi:hypothetical protein